MEISQHISKFLLLLERALASWKR